MSQRRRINWTFHTRPEVALPDGSPNIRGFGPDAFDVVYQPIVDARTGEVFAHEALVRCRRPEYANPTRLFAAASEQKTCGHLGRVIRQVAFERHPDGPLFVNIHPDELSSRWLVRPDDPMSLHAHDVYLEITETAAFTHYDLCMDVLGEVCSRLGASLVVDDFGVGHSTMRRVLDLRPAVVKLDRELVSQVHRDKRRLMFVSHIIDVCRDLGAKVVAECVETPEELSALLDAGADYVQGFLLARPGFPKPPVSWPPEVALAPPRRRPRGQRGHGPARP